MHQGHPVYSKPPGEDRNVDSKRLRDLRTEYARAAEFEPAELGMLYMHLDRRLREREITGYVLDFLCSGDMSKYHSFQEIIDALARGERIVIAGSKGDDIETYNALLKSLGVDETQLAYVTNDSTSSAITSLLGGHVDLVLGKQASCEQYIIAERMFPMVALCEDRFTSDLLKDMPSITEFGYEACDVPNWRGIVAPKAMSEAAADYWAECFRQVTETPEWDEYITRNGLVPMYMDRASTVQFMTEFQQSYLQSIGKDK